MNEEDDSGAAGNSATSPTTKANSTANLSPTTNARNSQIPTKRARLLYALLDGPKDSFELERAPVHDHCANSTVSELKKAGVNIAAQMIEVAGFAGITTRIARYSLTESGRVAAVKFLGRGK